MQVIDHFTEDVVVEERDQWWGIIKKAKGNPRASVPDICIVSPPAAHTGVLKLASAAALIRELTARSQ